MCPLRVSAGNSHSEVAPGKKPAWFKEHLRAIKLHLEIYGTELQLFALPRLVYQCDEGGFAGAAVP